MRMCISLSRLCARARAFACVRSLSANSYTRSKAGTHTQKNTQPSSSRRRSCGALARAQNDNNDDDDACCVCVCVVRVTRIIFGSAALCRIRNSEWRTHNTHAHKLHMYATHQAVNMFIYVHIYNGQWAYAYENSSSSLSSVGILGNAITLWELGRTSHSSAQC